ncbi:MAG TPA: hypothetical protein PKC79_16865 [Solidesulfovibrio magneticus]|nr:hypothetical protein [Solidesulfovibrio magneticus]
MPRNRLTFPTDTSGITRFGRPPAMSGPWFGPGPSLAAGTDQAVSMLCDPCRDLFAVDQAASPYLVDWSQAFADLDPTQAAPVALVFKRSPYPDVVERWLLPDLADPRARRIVELHLSARLNNVLSIAGAHGVEMITRRHPDAALLAAVRRNLLTGLDDFSNMSLYFLHGLVQSAFGRDLSINARQTDGSLPEARGHGGATGGSKPRLARPGLALAVNIGQHLTSWGLVRLTQNGGCVVERLFRRETCLDLTRCCLTAEIADILAAVRSDLGQAADGVEAVGISLAATVMEGRPLPVAQFGLFAACSQGELDHAATAIAEATSRAFPGRPAALVNDGRAQALFAFHFAGGKAAAGGGHLLALRLGACPCVHCLDADGHSPPGFDEFGWLAIRAVPSRPGGPLFSTPRHPLSHYGLAAAAHELGLLTRYGLGIEDAIPFFHGRLTSDDPEAAREAAGIYRILGAHLAMLAAEVHAHRPLGAIMVMGSQANRLEGRAFAAFSDGYAAFAAGRPLVPATARRILVEEASAEAGLVGAAFAALYADPA